MKKSRRITALVLALIFASAGMAQANIMFPGVFRYNTHTYEVYETKCSWHEAQEYCENLGGHLLTIGTEAENRYITNHVLADIGTAVMLGFTDEAEEGVWRWVNGEKSSYTNWAENEPNNENGENYALMGTDGKWNDGHLDMEKWAFICEYDTPTYPWRYGWRLTNNPPSFGYEYGGGISMWRYYETFGFRISSLLESTIGNIGGGANGLCFGMALLSLAEYYGIYDTSQLFTKSGEYPYDFGYETVVKDVDGKNFYSIKGNDAALAAFERAYISQSSVEFAECQIFPSDPDYSQLLEFMRGDDARPLLVNLEAGMSGHTVVLTADCPPIDTGDGYYWLPVYDPNTPMPPGDLANPTSLYDRGKAWLKVSPERGVWKLYGKGKSYMESDFYALTLTGLTSGHPGITIRFFDVSLLSPDYFTKPLNCWYNTTNIWVDGSDVEIRHGDKTLLDIEGGRIKDALDSISLSLPFGDSEGVELPGTFMLSCDYSDIEIISPDASVVVSSESCISAMELDGSCAVSVDLDAAEINADCISGGGRLNVAIQNFETGKTARLTGSMNAGEFSGVSVSSGGGFITCAEGVTAEYSEEYAGWPEADDEPEKRSAWGIFTDTLPIALPVSLALTVVISIISALRRRSRAAKACRCPSCGGPLEVGQKFCGQCGQMIEWR